MGLAFYQDMIALIVFSILWAFQRTMIDLDKAASIAGNSTAASIAGSGSASDARRAANSTTATASVDTWVPTNVWHNRYLLGDEIGRQIGTLVLVGVVFALLNRCGAAVRLLERLCLVLAAACRIIKSGARCERAQGQVGVGAKRPPARIRRPSPPNT